MSEMEIADSSTVTEAEVEVTEVDTEVAETDASAAETPEEPKRNRAQERINQLTREKHEERQRREELEARLSALESQKPETPESTSSAPQEMDFTSDAEYQRAQAEYVADQAAQKAYERLQADRQAADSQVQQRQQQEALAAKKTAFEESVNAKRDSFENFEEVAYGHPFMDTDLAEQIFDMEKGPEVAYHLGSHQDEAARIFALSPVQRARELTKLEFQVQALTPKVVSDAPDPISELGGNEPPPLNPDNMTADEWQAWRNKQLYG